MLLTGHANRQEPEWQGWRRVSLKAGQSTGTDFAKVRPGKLETLRERGIGSYPAEFHVFAAAEELASKCAGLKDGAETESRVTVAGRVRSSRNNGMFMDIRDRSGKIRVFSHRGCTGEESLQLLPLIDLGGFIGVGGLRVLRAFA